MSGLWDKSLALGLDRMDKELAQGEQFVLYGIQSRGTIDLENGLEPARSTALLVDRVAKKDDGNWAPFNDPFIVGTLAGPIADMVAQADSDDFPVICTWKQVPTKVEGQQATVLDLVDVSPKGIKRDKIPSVDGW